MNKTGAGLAQWARDIYAHRRHVYWYGTYCNPCTASLLAGKTKQYPEHYRDARQATYKQHIAQGKTCTDCVGLIKGYYWEQDGVVKYKRNGLPDKGASGMYSAAKITGKIATIPEIPGVLVWTNTHGHVGVYIGDGYVVEARGFAYGVQRNLLSKRSFTRWGLCPYVEYTPQEIETARAAAGMAAEAVDTGADGTPTLREGDKGEAVKEMQRLLLEAGCKLERYGADGHFGAETLEALKAYQTAHSLSPDGVCGPLTWKSLRSGESASEGQETGDTGTQERPTLRKGDKGEAVKEMQRLLLEAGCKLDRYGADGQFGAETLEAVKAFQTANGLAADGICGPLTWSKLSRM